MRRALTLLLAATAVLVSGCTGGGKAVDVDNGGEFRFEQVTPAGTVVPEADRKAAPTFHGQLLDGSPFTSTSLAGHVAVLNFWGSWCAPCRVESPEFQQIYDERKGDGVQFLGLNVKDQEQLATAFVESKGITYPSVYDPKGQVALAFRDYPPKAIPSTIVLDAQGRVAAVYTSQVRPEDLRAVLDTVLKEA